MAVLDYYKKTAPVRHALTFNVGMEVNQLIVNVQIVQMVLNVGMEVSENLIVLVQNVIKLVLLE